MQLSNLNSHLHFNCRVWVIVTYLKILCTEIIDSFDCASDLQFWKRSWLSLKLLVQDTESEHDCVH